MGDTTLNFAHNTNFTDIMWTNTLMVNFTGMNPHDGQMLSLRVVEEGSGTEVFRTTTMVSPEFMIHATGIENGKSYHVDFFADHNKNGMYDAPPADHAWRLMLNNVMGDTTLNFAHNTNFTDIDFTTGINKLDVSVSRLYPNPATHSVKIELKDVSENVTITVFDITGKRYNLYSEFISGSIELNLSELEPGTYFVQVRESTWQETHKLIKR
jgi:hypothetical protein